MKNSRDDLPKALVRGKYAALRDKTRNAESDTLGERIKARRKEREISQTDFARRIGISVTALRKIEEGTTKTPRDLQLIATVLEADPAWLQFGSNAARTTHALSKDETTLLSRYRQLNQDEKEFIAKCVAGLIHETWK